MYMHAADTLWLWLLGKDKRPELPHTLLFALAGRGRWLLAVLRLVFVFGC